MKVKLLIALVAGVVLVVLGYVFLSSNKKIKMPVLPTIIGSWKIDSVEKVLLDTLVLNHDSSFNFKKNETLEFKEDSSLRGFNSNTKKQQIFYVNDSILYVKKDTTFLPYFYYFTKDSLLQISINERLKLMLSKNK